jgi:hypothetical protein
MSWKDHRNKGRLPAFTAMFVDTTSSAAWRATSHGARSLFHALKRRYNRVVCGAVYLSARKAADELGSNKDYVTRWFRELQYYGFIVMMTPGHLGSEGVGKAPHWRITDEWYHDKPPTRDFHKWDGQRFHEQKTPSHYLRKKQNPVPQTGDSVSPKLGTVASPKLGTPTRSTVPQTGDIKTSEHVPQTGDISSLTIPLTAEGVSNIETATAHDIGPIDDPFAIPADMSIPKFMRRHLGDSLGRGGEQ